MTAEDLKLMKLAKLAAQETVAETFLLLGVDISTPAAKLAVQDDFRHLRVSRLGLRKVRNASIGAFCTVFFTGIGYMLWWGLKAAAAIGGKG